MATLTITYVRGRFLLGGRRISVEIDGMDEGTIEGGQSRTFSLPYGKHLVLLRYSHVTTRVDLTLLGDDSFTVSWDRTMGGMRITEEFEDERFLDRRCWKYFGFLAVIVFLCSLITGLRFAGEISTVVAMAGNTVLLAVLLAMLLHIRRRMSKTVVWGGE